MRKTILDFDLNECKIGDKVLYSRMLKQYGKKDIAVFKKGYFCGVVDGEPAFSPVKPFTVKEYTVQHTWHKSKAFIKHEWKD